MNRRSFMSGMLSLFAAPAIVRADSLMRIVVPSTAEVMSIGRGNQLLTIDMITREALRILHEKMSFVHSINKDYSVRALNQSTEQWAQGFDTITFRRSVQYAQASV